MISEVNMIKKLYVKNVLKVYNISHSSLFFKIWELNWVIHKDFSIENIKSNRYIV